MITVTVGNQTKFHFSPFPLQYRCDLIPFTIALPLVNQIPLPPSRRKRGEGNISPEFQIHPPLAQCPSFLARDLLVSLTIASSPSRARGRSASKEGPWPGGGPYWIPPSSPAAASSRPARAVSLRVRKRIPAKRTRTSSSICKPLLVCLIWPNPIVLGFDLSLTRLVRCFLVMSQGARCVRGDRPPAEGPRTRPAENARAPLRQHVCRTPVTCAHPPRLVFVFVRQVRTHASSLDLHLILCCYCSLCVCDYYMSCCI